MANVIIKSAERKAQAAAVLKAYGVGGGRATAAQRKQPSISQYVPMKRTENYREWEVKGNGSKDYCS